MKIPFWPEFKGFRDIKLGLDRMHQALERLDNPHKNLPEVIHIAGTNGKGSTLAFLRSIFESGGYKAHAYSSPHLVNFNERIYLAGADISDDFLNECLQECKDACETSPAIPLTFYEGTTLAAFLAFSKVKADVLILETGMGGRLDATNVLDEVMASIITPVSIDHAEFLGNSISKIAFEKAGIIKKNSLVICGKQKNEAFEVIEKQAIVLGSEFIRFDKDFEIEEKNQKWIFKNKKGVFEFDKSQYLNQQHQLENLSSVLAFILKQNKFSFDFENVNEGIVNAKWPARLEKIENGNLYNRVVDIIGDTQFELIVDGGHNSEAGDAVNSFLNSKSDKFKIIIFSMVEDKDYKEYLSKIAGEIDLLIACDIENSVNNRSTDEICDFAKEIKLPCIKSSLIEKAIDEAVCFTKSNQMIKDCVILVAGSLYLAGNFIEKNQL